MVNIPYNFTPYPYQREILADPARFKIVVLHRRAGKSKTALNELIRRAAAKPGVYAHVFPYYNQVKKAVWLDPEMLSHHLPDGLVIKKNESELWVEINSKGGKSLIYFLGADKPENILGMRFDGVVFDEYAQMKEEFWTRVIRPILGKSGGWAMFVFTPQGKNHAWKLMQQAKELKDWSTWVLSVQDTRDEKGRPLFPAEELEAIRQVTPEALFRQEYMVEFIDDATSVFPNTEALVADPDRIKVGAYGLPADPCQFGIDLAKYRDYTVIASCNARTRHVSILERCNLVGWAEQKARINNYAKRYNVKQMVMDATGVGDPIVEEIELLGHKVYPYKFTMSSREILLRNLAVHIENATITLDYNEELLDELGSMRYEMKTRSSDVGSSTSRIVMKVPDGTHDDMIMAVALAIWQVDKISLNEYTGRIGGMGPYLQR